MLLSAISTRSVAEEECFEGPSRAMFSFNMAFDRAILKPIAKGYNKLPEPIRKGTGNFTSNIATLLSIPNHLLQGNLKGAGDASASFAINTTVGILGFVFLFKIGEAFLGRMSIIFYKEIGFTKGDIAIYSKTLGWITTVIFTLLGGLFVIRSGVLKAMFLAGILMASTNLLFTALAWSEKSELLFAVAVIFDDIAAAFATVAFVAFISLLVDRTYTATQYALLASIGTAGRTTLASSSGALVDWLNGDWGIFFILTAIMVIPSLICLWFIRNKLKLREK